MRWKYLLPLAVFLILSGFLFKGLYLNPREVPSAMIDKPAPEFALPDLMDPARTVTKKDLLGSVYLLNVWASWCEACRYEHPFFNQIKMSGYPVVIVGYNYRDKIPAARAWLAQLGNPYDVCVMDANNKFGIDFGVYGAPETFVIDKKGVIRHKVIGAVTSENWQSTLLPLLKKLENEQ
ncbi:MAG: DsbE family thiol:disulfide interchange protein [Duodenibacillus sp.]|nr:DsbE family thiol:disulfide interchange protein [Duodenibacillus sp.]